MEWPNRRIREVLSWRLAAEVMGRHPGELRLVEAHGGGGQYDELRIYGRSAEQPATFLISLNRSGGAHFRGADAAPWVTFWEDALAAEDPKAIVDEQLEGRAELASDGHLRAATPEVVTVRVIALLLAHTAFERERWEARSGCCDSSYGTSVRHTYFDPFPLCHQRLEHKEPGDLMGEPGYRFWFLVKNGDPRLAFEENGRAWDRDGEELNVVARYSRAGSLWPVVAGLSTKAFR